jgi:hypothetical protein
MILLIIFLTLMLICWHLIYKNSFDKSESRFGSWCIGYLLFSSMAAFLFYLLSSLVLYSLPFVNKTSILQFETKLISMSNNSGVEGSFILGTGSIRETRYYIYKVIFDDGGIKEFMAPIHQSIIYETDETPKIQKYTFEMSKNISYVTNPEGNLVYKFYVPRGCIIKEFSIK